MTQSQSSIIDCSNIIHFSTTELGTHKERDLDSKDRGFEKERMLYFISNNNLQNFISTIPFYSYRNDQHKFSMFKCPSNTCFDLYWSYSSSTFLKQLENCIASCILFVYMATEK